MSLKFIRPCLDGGRHNEPDDELEGEPDVADELHEEEGLVRVGLGLVQGPEGDVAPIVADCHVPIRRRWIVQSFI